MELPLTGAPLLLNPVGTEASTETKTLLPLAEISQTIALLLRSLTSSQQLSTSVG